MYIASKYLENHVSPILMIMFGLPTNVSITRIRMFWTWRHEFWFGWTGSLTSLHSILISLASSKPLPNTTRKKLLWVLFKQIWMLLSFFFSFFLSKRKLFLMFIVGEYGEPFRGSRDIELWDSLKLSSISGGSGNGVYSTYSAKQEPRVWRDIGNSNGV